MSTHCRIAVVVAAFVFAGVGTVTAQSAKDAAWWRRPIRGPDYTEVLRSSAYVPMRDSVRLAVDVYLPAGLPPGAALPTIIEQTRSWRSFDYPPPLRASHDRPSSLVTTLVLHGYACVIVDVRGTGASFGSRAAEFSKTEVGDGRDLVDWVVRQPWSNGLVGATGVSYSGTAADLLLEIQHPAVKAIVPRFALYDAFTDNLAPGGIVMDWLLKTWGEGITALDRNAARLLPSGIAILGVRPVDGDSGRILLARAIKQRGPNVDVRTALSGLVFRDDVGAGGYDFDALSTHRNRQLAMSSGAAVYSYSGWWDGAYPASAIKRFRARPTSRRRLLIGPWTHDGRTGFDPDRGMYASGFDHDGEILRFFDWTLRGLPGEIEREPPIHYYTMVENAWKGAQSWPIRAKKETWYLAAERGLTVVLPGRRPSGKDRYPLDPDVGTGSSARWNTLINGDLIEYPDRRYVDQRLLSYSSDPLAADVEVTGHPMANIFLTSDATDGALFVYLEDVYPDGRVAYVTEGQLRAIHRAVSRPPPLYPVTGPYHTFLRQHATPLKPGQVAELDIELIPTSYLFRRGHRVRVALAGADRDHFSQLPGTASILEVLRTPRYPSRIVLPIIPRR